VQEDSPDVRIWAECLASLVAQTRPDLGSNKLQGLVFGHLQDRACQDTVGVPEFIQNREVICVDDRNQVAGEMRPRPVCMVISATCDHGRQLARAIRDGERLIDARPAHGREGFDFDFAQIDLIVDMGGIA
jgi:hypothetical protein